MLTISTEFPPFVIRYVCRAFGVTWGELRSKDRNRRLGKARQVVVWLLLERCGLTLCEAGDWIDRDHTTAIYHREQARKDLEQEGWQRAVDHMWSKIEQEAKGA